ncbi:MAG: hypothetical protein ACYDBV_08195 [Nitrospiria bacterium]
MKGKMIDVAQKKTRKNEWFVPRFGPEKFRAAAGLLFLPYTGMVLSFTLIGSMLSPQIYWDRVLALLVIYFLALGIGAHALDAVGSQEVKPWGEAFNDRTLWIIATLSVIAAYAIAIYYMVNFSPLLWTIALPEGFFLLAYNLEWFNGKFHTDLWFSLSWGMLPTLAGYILQTNSISFPIALLSFSMGLLSLVEIKASRPYKALKQGSSSLPEEKIREQISLFEGILKSITLGVILLGLSLLVWRGNGS